MTEQPVLQQSVGVPFTPDVLTRLAALKREWTADDQADPDPARFEDLVTRGEAVLTTELGGWVQHMTELCESCRLVRPMPPARLKASLLTAPTGAANSATAAKRRRLPR